jgi:hypothetical protein
VVGIKGKAGRKRKFNDEYHRVASKLALERYYQKRGQELKQRRKYHKRIKDYSIEHNISFEEARKKLREIRLAAGAKD